MPTTTEMTWDCPECCGGAGTCDGMPMDLVVSGIASGAMTQTSAGQTWTFTSLLPGPCNLTVTVTCENGVLTASAFYVGISPLECTTGVAVDGDVESSDPVLINFEIPALPSGCVCTGGTLTVSE